MKDIYCYLVLSEVHGTTLRSTQVLFVVRQPFDLVPLIDDWYDRDSVDALKVDPEDLVPLNAD